ncbi:MAG: amidohydrolase family protein [Verrucomicrobiota bacterium]
MSFIGKFPSLVAALFVWGLTIEGWAVTVFENFWLIDGVSDEPVEGAAMVVDGERIVAVGVIDSAPWLEREGAEVVDLEGGAVMPGLISNHSHVGIVKGGTVSPENFTPEVINAELRQFEGYGVLTVAVLGMSKDLLYELRDKQRRGVLGGAEVFTADRGLGVYNAVPPVPLGTSQVLRPRSAEEASRMVREMAARHPDFIKIWVDNFFGTKPPEMATDVYAAIIEEADRHGIPVASHVFYLRDAKSLTQNGVDFLAHSVRDQAVDEELLALMKRDGVAYVPTLTLDESQFIYSEHPVWMDTPAFRASVSEALRQKWLTPAFGSRTLENPFTAKHRAALAQALENVKLVYDAGILVGFGTDSGANPYRIPGWAEHRELQLLVEAGLTPMQAIQTATGNAAKVLGDEENRGTLAKGKLANFLLLRANPLDDIRNTTKLEAIYHRGKRIEPAFSSDTSRAE